MTRFWKRALLIGALGLVLLPVLLVSGLIQIASWSYHSQKRAAEGQERVLLRELEAVRRRSAPSPDSLPAAGTFGHAPQVHPGPKGFANLTVPVEPGNSLRTFCVDASGLIRFSVERAPAPAHRRCLPHFVADPEGAPGRGNR